MLAGGSTRSSAASPTSLVSVLVAVARAIPVAPTTSPPSRWALGHHADHRGTVGAAQRPRSPDWDKCRLEPLGLLDGGTRALLARGSRAAHAR
jgi:hypothetical protein